MTYTDGKKFSPINSCKDASKSGYMMCNIQLRNLDGVAQDRAGFLIPATHGDIGVATSLAF